jgi:hypothetical protein
MVVPVLVVILAVAGRVLLVRVPVVVHPRSLPAQE